MIKQLKVLELFAGTRSIGKAFEAQGHEVFSIEWDKKHPDIDWYTDIGLVTAQDILARFGKPDIIWASPDCTSYSVAGIGYHREKMPDGTLRAKTDYGKFCDKVNQNVLKLIEDLQPTYFFIENPRGGMRKMSWMQHLPRYTVTYCFSGGTRFITKDGTKTFEEMNGRKVEVLSHGGWVKTNVDYHGKQKLYKLTVSRAKKKKEIFVTGNHKWFVKDQVIETVDLKQKMLLEYCSNELYSPDEVSNEYVSRGIVYGDGYTLKAKEKKRKEDCSIGLLYGDKKELLPYFDGFGLGRYDTPINGCETIKIHKLPKEWKTEIPSISEDKSLIYSWLSGLFATDGSISKAGQCTISSAKKEDMLKIKDLFMILGIGTSAIQEYWRKGFNDYETPIYSISIMRSDLTEHFFLLSKHRERFNAMPKSKHTARRWSVVSVEETDLVEDVYCCEVPEFHSFTLEDGILTHNCQYGETRMKPTDLWTNHPDPKFHPPCKNGDSCHDAAPRGARTGTQGITNKVDKSRIPTLLCEHIVKISEE